MGTASITDLDGDTKIQVEETADDDNIRFDTAGSERMKIDSTGDVAIGSRGTNPMGLSMVGTVLALTEQTNVASFQMDGNQAARIDMGSGPGTRQFVIYTDTSNYSSLERKDQKPILFATNNTERFRILQDGGIQLAAGNDISNASGDLTLDVVGSIILDADDTGNVSFKDAGTRYGYIEKAVNGTHGTDNLIVFVTQADGDFVVKGKDGNSTITALTLDMSEAGAATFNSTINFKFLNTTWINSADGINRLYYTANSTSFYKTADDHVFRNASDANRFSIDNGGNGIFSGNVTAYGTPSDLKLKEDIEVIDNAVDKIKQLKGITYTLKSDGNRLTGLVAQDLEKVLPEAVYTEKDIETKDEHLAIRYGNTVGLLVEAIKEQQEQIEALTAKVKELEDK